MLALANLRKGEEPSLDEALTDVSASQAQEEKVDETE